MNSTTNGDATNFQAPPAPQLPSEPAVLSSTIEGAIGRIGDIAAKEMEQAADDIMEAAEHIAAQFRRLAAAMRLTVDGHGKAASDFCARMRSAHETVRFLSPSFEPPRPPPAEGQEPEPEPVQEPPPKFLRREYANGSDRR